jgi:hypothetical protein
MKPKQTRQRMKSNGATSKNGRLKMTALDELEKRLEGPGLIVALT